MTTYLLPPTITGPTLLAILFNWGSMGVLAAQLCTFTLSTRSWLARILIFDVLSADLYHEHFQRDSARAKFLVYSLFLLDVLQTAMVTADAFHWFVYGFGNLILADQTFLNSWDVPVLDSIISLIAQSFYCWRIYILRKGLRIPFAILLVSLTQFAAGIATGIKGHDLGQLSLLTEGDASSETVVPSRVWLAGGAAADVAIAAVLSWTLLRERSYCLPPNQTIISRLVRHIVETNALTAGVAVISVILFWAASPEAAASVATPIAILGKLYTNCLLALFNNRVNHRMNYAANRGMVSLHLSPNPDLDVNLDLGPRQSDYNHNSQHHSIPRSMEVHVERQMDSRYDSVVNEDIRVRVESLFGVIESNIDQIGAQQKPNPIFVPPKSLETKSSSSPATRD
ncbi:hypothetical protein C8R45DRAFT_923083 [Mycena sanguinolenta]|nr:hypothetical protein C8R45DRAFT_923083 [Mycena sanguinolenta]